MEMVVKLGDICSFQSGGTPSRRNPEYFSGNIPWITTTALNGKKIGRNDAVALITEQAVAESAAKIVPAGSIMVGTRVGVGKVAINTEVMSTSQDIISLLNIDENVWDKEFLCKFLQSKSSFLNSQARGATIKGIKIDVLSELDLPVMSKEEQTHISEIVDNVKKLISIRQQQLEKLDELVKARFVEMFGDSTINNKNWERQPLGELCTIVRGGSPRPIEQFLGGDVPWIKIGDATDGDSIYLRSTKEHIIREGVKKSRLIKAGSLIFANCGVSLGFARIITFDGCIHDGWLAMENIDRKLDKIFLLQALNQMTNHFRAIAPAGTQPNLNTSIMKDYLQIIPPLELQKEYIQFCKSVDKSKVAVQKSLDEAQLLFDSLMQQYFG